MMQSLGVAIVIILILFSVYVWATSPGSSSVGHWAVSTKYANYPEAAATLDRINARLMKLLDYLQRKYHIDESDDTIFAEGNEHVLGISKPQRDYVSHLLDNYNFEAIVENDPAVSDNTSLTIGKGKVLYLCLRDKRDPMRIIDDHTLFFVLLHEISHIANFAHTGHGEEFWRVFKFILAEAKAAGVHDPVDYKKSPIVFCGLTVDYSPYYDANIQPI